MPIKVSAPRQRAVLALLLLEAGRTVPAHRLVEEIWGEDAPDTALNNLQVQVSALRRELRVTVEGAPAEEAVRAARHGGYVLDIARDAVDVYRFERSVTEGREHLDSGSPQRAAEVLSDALRLWRGAPLEEFRGFPFADVAKVRLGSLQLSAVADRVDASMRLGQAAAVIPELTDLVRRHPLNERLLGQLMLALYACGQQADAPKVYRQARESLADELGVDPGRDLQALHQRILQRDPTLTAPAAESAAPSQGGSLPVRGAFQVLPVPVTSLVGRQDEIDQTVALLQPESPVRLVSLVGAGGSGKTRIAVEVARRMTAILEDGVHVVPLAPIERPADVLPEVHRRLGVPEEPGQDLLKGLSGHLRLLDYTLLVLDNFEQVIDAADELVALIQQAPKLKILLTSRAALNVSGEYEVRVQPLPLPVPAEGLPGALRSDAVRLFVERASAVSGLRLTDENAFTIGQLCLRLDGLPLALELAAARTKLLSPQAMLPRLEHSLALLTGGPRDLPLRQRSLRAAIDWSYRLLGDDEARLLARLAVFPAGWTLDAADSVADPNGLSVLQLQAQLLDKNFILSDGDGRFRMLRTVREYALEQLLSSDEHEAVYQSFIAWCIVTANALEESRQQESVMPTQASLDAFEQEHANFTAALDKLLAQDDAERLAELVSACSFFWYATGRLAQCDGWLRQVLRRGGSSRQRRATVLTAASVLALALATDLDTARAEALHREALSLLEQMGRPTLDAHGNLVVTLCHQGRFTEAIRELERGLATQPGDPWWTGNLGQAYMELGDYEAAAPLIQGAVETAIRGESPIVLASTLMQRSVLELGQGQPEQARATVLAALGVIDTGPVHPQERAWDLVVGGGVALCAGDAALARALLSEAAELMLEVGHRLQVADALAALGLARLAEGGDPATAARLLGASGDVRGRSGCVLQGRHLRARLADDERRYNAVLASSDRLAGALAASSADGLKRLLKQACNS